MRILRNQMQMCLLCVAMLPAVVQAQFLFTTNNGTITITRYIGPPTNAVAIPSITNGLPVTGIGGSLFAGATSLNTVTIPDSITSIGDNAFYNCTGLTNFTIPDRSKHRPPESDGKSLQKPRDSLPCAAQNWLIKRRSAH